MLIFGLAKTNNKHIYTLKMSNKNTVFHRSNQEVLADFNLEGVSSDGALLLLEKLERQEGLVSYYSGFISDKRNSRQVVDSIEKMLLQRVFLLMQGYCDGNDISALREDAVVCDVLGCDLVSQPSISRFENSISKADIFSLSEAFVARYISSLQGKERIIIDADATDDPTHGKQQLSLFNGYYGQRMYNELFFHDGQSGQVILPVLRSGNSHSNKWYVAILGRIIKRIRACYPDLEIIIRADSGFSTASFYELAERYDLKYVIGLPSNNVLKKRVKRAKEAVEFLYVQKAIKHQHFMTYSYQAGTWHKEQRCYAKIESTGKGINIRHIVSNLEGKTGREIYWQDYVKRGESSENRIKEVKNMCFADRLSNHRYWANYFRLFLACIAYQIFVILKERIAKTSFEEQKKWQVNSIRTFLLKVATRIRKTKKRIYYSFSKTMLHKDLLFELLVYQ